MFKQFNDKQKTSVNFEDPAMQMAYMHGIRQGVAREQVKSALLTIAGTVCSLFVAGIGLYNVHKVNVELRELSSEEQFERLVKEEYYND